ncbi:MAG: hypothetical protein V2J24_23615 [Pseudomonadales bacterium]|jgi:hypothetical protein|nr:hypothetical protein [Pseudomonadales bacterium]
MSRLTRALDGLKQAQAQQARRAAGAQAFDTYPLAPAEVPWDEDRLLVSTRVPRGKQDGVEYRGGAPSDGERLIVGVDALRQPGGEKALAQNANVLATDTLGLPRNRYRNPDARIAETIDQVAQQLVRLYSAVPENVRGRTRQWYRGANRFANEQARRFNRPPHEMAGVLAALSPQKDWFQNADLARRLVEINDLHMDTVVSPEMVAKLRDTIQNATVPKGRKRPTEIGGVSPEQLEASIGTPMRELPADQQAVAVRMFDEMNNPREYPEVTPEGDVIGLARAGGGNGEPKKIAWGSIGEIRKALSILQDSSPENVSRQLGGAHKVRNFYNNILDPDDPFSVTIDTHAVAAAFLQPLSGKATDVKRNLSGGDGSGSSGPLGLTGTYPILADAYRVAADAVGVSPREMQSITWEAIRGAFPDHLKRNKKFLTAAGQLAKDLKAGRMTPDEYFDAIAELSISNGGTFSPMWSEMRGAMPGVALAGLMTAAMLPEDAEASPLRRLLMPDEDLLYRGSTTSLADELQQLDELGNQRSLFFTNSPHYASYYAAGEATGSPISFDPERAPLPERTVAERDALLNSIGEEARSLSLTDNEVEFLASARERLSSRRGPVRDRLTQNPRWQQLQQEVIDGNNPEEWLARTIGLVGDQQIREKPEIADRLRRHYEQLKSRDNAARYEEIRQIEDAAKREVAAELGIDPAYFEMENALDRQGELFNRGMGVPRYAGAPQVTPAGVRTGRTRWTDVETDMEMAEGDPEYQQRLRDEGVDTLAWSPEGPGEVEGTRNAPYGTEQLLLRPDRQVRPIFDPARLAGVGGAAVGAGMLAPEEAEAGVVSSALRASRGRPDVNSDTGEQAQPALDMSDAARMERAREMGFEYTRVTRGADSPLQPGSEATWAMFERNPDIEYGVDRLSSYGEHGWLSRADDAVDVEDIQADIVRSLRRRGLQEEYQATAASLARDAAPTDIVNSAGLWDSPDLVQAVYEDVLEPRGISAVRTPNGLVRFPDDYGEFANTRSVNAAFDPAERDSSDLLAGVGGAAVGAGILGAGMAPEEAEAGVVPSVLRAVDTTVDAAEAAGKGAATLLGSEGRAFRTLENETLARVYDELRAQGPTTGERVFDEVEIGDADGLRSRGATPAARFRLPEPYQESVARIGRASPDLIEISPDDAGARVFAESITAAKDANRFGASVYVYPTDEYKGMRLFLTEDGAAGYALKPDGDIVSAFSDGTHKGVAQNILLHGVENGGKKLDAFDTVLPEMYSQMGFDEAARLRWDDDEAPPDWDKGTFGRFNDGEPDVSFMGYSEAPARPVEPRYVDDYGQAMDAQEAMLRAPRGRTDVNWATGEQAQRWTRSQLEQGNYVLVNVPTEELIERGMSGTFDVRNPENQIGDRLSKARARMERGMPMDPPVVGLTRDGIAFDDGRHRALAALELGQDTIPVMVPRDDADRFLARVPDSYRRPAGEDPGVGAALDEWNAGGGQAGAVRGPELGAMAGLAAAAQQFADMRGEKEGSTWRSYIGRMQDMGTKTFGAAEMAGHIGSGMIADAVGGLGGIAELVSGSSAAEAARRVEDTQSAMMPRGMSPAGQEIGMELLGALEKGGQYARREHPVATSYVENVPGYWRDRVVPALQEQFGAERGSAIAAALRTASEAF